MADIAGFWSYVHSDNESVGDAIVKLAKRVMDEFELLSAEPLRLFIDRDLAWGEEWKGRIDRELQETTFFIPIITPRYFQSEECRRELLEFRSAADRFGVKQLLLPIYYVTVPEMEEAEPTDELMALVKSIQREDMRKVRLAEEWDATHRDLVNRLATRLLKVSRETEGLSIPSDEVDQEPAVDAMPPQDHPFDGGRVTPRAPSGGANVEASTVSVAVDDEGSLDVLAAGEEALGKWGETLVELNREIEAIGNVTGELTPAMAAAKSFAAQLAVANKLAVQLDEPAENLIRIAQDYSTNLITVDPAVQTLINNARTNDALKDETQTKELFSVILGMVQTSRTGAKGIQELIASMEEPAAASRELRQPLRKIQTSLRNIADGQKILDDWEAQLRDVFGDSLDAS